MDVLVEAHPNSAFQSGVPVLDRLDVRAQPGLDSRFLASFAHCSRLRLFARIDDTLGKLPPALGAYGNDRDFDSIFVPGGSIDHSSG